MKSRAASSTRAHKSDVVRGFWPLLPLALVMTFAYFIPSLWEGPFALELLFLCVIYSVLAVSLNLVFDLCGYLDFSHIAFFGLGAYVTTISSQTLGLALIPAAALACVVVALVSALIGRFTLHLAGFFFAMITMAASELIRLIIVTGRSVTGGATGMLVSVTSSVGHRDWGFGRFDSTLDVYNLALVVGFILLGAAFAIYRSDLGLRARALRDSEPLARSVGVAPMTTRLTIYVISSVMAAICGVLYVLYFRFVTPDSMDLQASLLLLLMILVGGRRYTLAPIVGALVFALAPPLVEVPETTKWVVFGFVLLALIIFLPEGLGGTLGVLFNRRRMRAPALTPSMLTSLAARVSDLARSGGRPSAPELVNASPVLEVRDVSISFGGVPALVTVSCEIRPAEVLGLVGPNGSGKTTLFNIISGFLMPDKGRVRIFGKDTTGASPEQIARLGLTRTFQHTAVFNSLSIHDNLRIPMLGRGYDDSLLKVVAGYDLLGRATAEKMGHGSQRLLQIAIALATAPRVLLLDEPGAGLTYDEREWLARLVSEVTAQGTAVIIIEHNMELISDMCDRVMVLNVGRIQASGSPHEVMKEPAVIEAYLGPNWQTNDLKARHA